MRIDLLPTHDSLKFQSALWMMGIPLFSMMMGPAFAGSESNTHQFHQQALVFDAHADTPLRMMDLDYQLGERHTEHHIDLPRMREGGIDIQGFALWVDPRKYETNLADRAFALLDAVEKQVEKNATQVAIIRTASEARQVVAEGKIGILIGLESGHAIENDLEILRRFHERGVRYMTLTWMNTNDWADSSDDERRWEGLNELGESIIREMNRLGMMIDLSHASDDTVRDVLAISRQPVILTHSCCRALCDIPRNISDDLIKEVAQNGGVIGVNFYLGYLVNEYAQGRKTLKEEYHSKRDKIRELYDPESDEYKSEIKRLKEEEEQRADLLPSADANYRVIVDHIDHIVKIAGIDHVGLGSDFDGVSKMPDGIKDVTDVPKITQELMARGYSAEDIRKILGENFMRVFSQICDR